MSGAPSDCPSAFVHQFKTHGVYYYISAGLAKSFGAVVVSSQPRVNIFYSMKLLRFIKAP